MEKMHSIFHYFGVHSPAIQAFGTFIGGVGLGIYCVLTALIWLAQRRATRAAYMPFVVIDEYTPPNEDTPTKRHVLKNLGNGPATHISWKKGTEPSKIDQLWTKVGGLGPSDWSDFAEQGAEHMVEVPKTGLLMHCKDLEGQHYKMIVKFVGNAIHQDFSKVGCFEKRKFC